MLYLFCVLYGSATAFVNLYISLAEMNRTLGINAELSYIDGGKVNGYSTKFPYRVDADLDHISFTWNAVGKVSYSIRADSEDMSVLPVVHIPLTGDVPSHQQEFSVEFRCAGHRSGQFTVSLHFNFTNQSGNRITAKLRQEKICASRDGRRGFIDYHQGTYEETERTFFIIIGCAASFLIIMGILLISYVRKSKKSEDRCPATNKFPSSFRSSSRTISSGLSAQLFLTSTPTKEKYLQHSPLSLISATSSILGTSSLFERQNENNIIRDKQNQINVRKALVSLHADRDLLHFVPFVEIEGTFGEMRFAIWRQPEEALNGDVDDEEDVICNDEAVICKTLKKDATPSHLEKFLLEALAFHQVTPHENIAQVACVASYGRFESPETVVDFPVLCYRHQGFGNLKKFLINLHDGDSKKGTTLSTHELVSMILQVAKALVHLHSLGIIHKDVATRNCLVAESSSHLLVQLSDNSLSRDFFPQEYHCLGDNENRPIRWMAVEAIRDNSHTSASDVWSFGVLSWELLSLGSTPFDEIDPEDMLSTLLKGIRLIQPYNCPDQLYQVIFSCWYEKVNERPSSEQVVSALQEFTVQLHQFV